MIWLALLLAAPDPGEAVRAGATANRATLRLSESAVVTLTVEGDAPLRVTPPAAWLDGEAGANWSARPLGPPGVRDLGAGRQRWVQALRLDPYVPGDALTVALSPVAAQAGADGEPREVRFTPLTFRVTTTVNPAIDTARGGTGIENLPPSPHGPKRFGAWVTVPAAGAVLLTLLLGRRWARHHADREMSPDEQFRARLTVLDDDSLPQELFADGVSTLVRDWLEVRYGRPARSRTPAELREPSADRAIDPALAAVLDLCDAVRFAGATLDPAERSSTLETLRRLLTPESGAA